MKQVRFPKRIKRGSCVVTIYRTPTKGYRSFTVVRYDSDGTRRRLSFADYPKARKAAMDVAKELDEVASVRFVARGRQLVVNRQAHIVSLAFIMQRPGQSVTHEMVLAKLSWTATANRLHFHELVHIVQWRLLGLERFLAVYADGLERFGWRDSPLEEMAYRLDGLFQRGGAPFSVEQAVG